MLDLPTGETVRSPIPRHDIVAAGAALGIPLAGLRTEATPPEFYDRPMRDTANDARPISVSLLIELETFAKPSQIEHVLEEMLRAVKLGVNNRARAYTPNPDALAKTPSSLDAAARHLQAGHFVNNGYWREVEVELS